jgi:hypothetical protein
MAQEDLIAKVAAKLPQPEPAPDAEQVTTKREGDVLEARSTSRRIKTVEDLLAHIEADLQRYEVAASEATKWECATSDGKGGTTVTELHRVFVRLKPKAGPTTREVVEAMIAGAVGLKQRPVSRHKKQRGELWQVIVVADTHVGKYAWGKTTGHGDYDLDIADRVIRQTSNELIAVGNEYKPARRSIFYLGDLFHYDSPHGTTTSGTQLERDGRLQKMIEVGSDALLSIVEQSAATTPTDVHVVNGNHDGTLSWCFQRILFERFRNDQRVAVSMKFTGRQYVTHGANLLGIAHGHRAKRKLPQIMAIEAAGDWARCPYREYHTGHFHSQAAEWQRPIETIESVIVRTAPSVGGTDDWSSEHGFIGARRAMETFLYRPEGGLTAMHVAGVKP